jgi:RNA polymerase II subunit A small phosphatase-like protein
VPRFDKLLILDLDETLIFGTPTPLAHPPDFRAEPYHVYRRPQVAAFLDYCLDAFEVAVWTSASRGYAGDIVRNLFPAPERLSFLWSVERCTNHRNLETMQSHWLKDLNKVRRRGYPLERVLMVDDSPEKLARSYGNLVRVSTWEGDPADDELGHLAAYLETLGAVPSVRAVEKRGWRHRIAAPMAFPTKP